MELDIDILIAKEMKTTPEEIIKLLNNNSGLKAQILNYLKYSEKLKMTLKHI